MHKFFFLALVSVVVIIPVLLFPSPEGRVVSYPETQCSVTLHHKARLNTYMIETPDGSFVCEKVEP